MCVPTRYRRCQVSLSSFVVCTHLSLNPKLGQPPSALYHISLIKDNYCNINCFIRYRTTVRYKCVHKQMFAVEISKLIVFLFVFCFRSVYLDLDEEAFANIKDSVKDLWNLIGWVYCTESYARKYTNKRNNVGKVTENVAKVLECLCTRTIKFIVCSNFIKRSSSLAIEYSILFYFSLKLNCTRAIENVCFFCLVSHSQLENRDCLDQI